MQAAADIFVERGYDAATMTAIAARARASIGSLYQFFPSKSLLAEAVHLEALAMLASEMEALRQDLSADESVADITDSLFARLLAFMQKHPSFLVMAERRDVAPERKARTRQALRDQIASLLALARPPPPPARCEILAVLVLSMMRSAIALQGEKSLPSRDLLIAELRTMLRHHLEAGV